MQQSGAARPAVAVSDIVLENRRFHFATTKRRQCTWRAFPLLFSPLVSGDNSNHAVSVSNEQHNHGRYRLHQGVCFEK